MKRLNEDEEMAYKAKQTFLDILSIIHLFSIFDLFSLIVSILSIFASQPCSSRAEQLHKSQMFYF